MNTNDQKKKSQSKPVDNSPDAAETKKISGVLDLDRLRLSQDFGKSVGVKKIVTTVPVRKPNPQDFIRVHPDSQYSFEAGILELKDEGEIFIVDQDLWAELPGEIVPKILLTTINRQKVLTLWPIKLPDMDGRIDNWNHSAMEAAAMAREQWLRVMSNRSLGAYEVFAATGNLPEPEWPDIEMQEILNTAFRGKVIDTMDHPAIRRLRGDL